MNIKQSYTEWMAKVDAELVRVLNLDSGDLPDVCYADMFDCGETPKEAAREAMRQAIE